MAAAQGAGPSIDVQDRGFLLGDGVFDTMAAAAGVGLAADRHRARLVAHARVVGIASDPSAVAALQDEVLREIGASPAIVRTTVTRGRTARGLWPSGLVSPTIVVTAEPWNLSLVGQPARLVLASAPRNERAATSRIKALGYLDAILAAREAAEAGADDALLLNTQGRVASTTIANVFRLAGDRLETPPVTEGCLDGVVRQIALEEAQALGLATAETRLTPTDLLDADAVFLTNSVRLLRPVSRMDDRDVPRSPVVDALLDRLVARFNLTIAAP
jgi:branched-chain amino acid aminotransferase